MLIKSAEPGGDASTQPVGDEENNSAHMKSLMRLRNLRSRRLLRVKAKATLDINANIVTKAEKTETGECFFCGEQTSNSCQFCDGIFFCSKDHLAIHRPDNYCHPFIVKRDPAVGRYTVASRDIRPCELILREKPAASGPYTRTVPVCLQCYKHVSGEYLCPVCNCPMCSWECAQGSVHQLECQYAASKNTKFTIKSYSIPSSLYSSITILRMLLTKSSDPQTYSRIMNLMDHAQERQAEGTYAMTNMKLNVKTFLKKHFGEVEFTECEIERSIGILRTNGMKLEQNSLRQSPGVVLYPVYCLINHACYNNTNYTKCEDLHLQLRAQVAIQAGAEISTRYVSSTLGNCRRRRDLSRYWYFDCRCVRCSDSSEMGTHMSSVRCVCTQGLAVKREALDWDSDWVCQACQRTVPGKEIEKEVNMIEEELAEIDMTDTDLLEELIAVHCSLSLLHPSHYLVIDLMHSLVIAYSAKERLTRPQQERKVQLCLQVLEVLGTVDPGFTNWRGKLLHEMATSLLLLSRADYASGSIAETVFKRRLYFCMRALATAKRCMQAGFAQPGRSEQ